VEKQMGTRKFGEIQKTSSRKTKENNLERIQLSSTESEERTIF
jgi:hypothetical protein